MKAQENAPARLVWNEGGQVGCTRPTHAPYPGTDTWHTGRWREMTVVEQRDFEAEVGHAPVCESCAAEARKAARS